MKYVLIILFGAMCTSASAQWYRIDLKLKKKFSPPPSEELTIRYVARFPAPNIFHPKIFAVKFRPTEYSIEANEAIVMKEAQHNMRFRIYNEASYNFSELARLYIQQNRLSEAKWYFLQSLNISREQNDDKHTVSNLIELGTIQASLGELTNAEQDLTEARELATSKGLNEYIETIDLATQYIRQNRPQKQKPVLVYADDAQNTAKAE